MKFIRSVMDEMKKVTWPSGKQLRRDTIIVLQMSILFGVFFFVVDTLISTALTAILK